jgi:hypothetical protein
MTVKTLDPGIKVQQALDARNREVEKSFSQIIQAAKPLLNAFDGKKYRTCILINHAESGRETNLISEFLCHFFNLTLTKNPAGYVMLYVTYDADSITRFGARLYNRVLRQVFKHTMKASIEDCVRVNNPGNVQQFFMNRLANGENDFVSIDVQEKESN